MTKRQQFNHVRETNAAVAPPPKTWKTPTYHLERYTVRRHVRVVRVELQGVQGRTKRTESISFPLLPGMSDIDLVRAAVWFSPNKWMVPIRMNVSQFNGKFSSPVDERLISLLMNPKLAAVEPYQQPLSIPAAPSAQAPVSTSQRQFQQQPLPQPGQFQAFNPPPTLGSQKGIRQWYKNRSRGAKIGLWWSAFIVFLLFAYAIGNAVNSAAPSTSSSPSPTAQQVALLSSPAVTQQTQPTAVPTHVPTARPTLVPTHAVQPTQPPKPTSPPPTPTTCPGINCNPWGYNFVSGRLIYYPPSNFCNYFNCIPSFWEPDDPGDGYVVQCSDGMYSQSGGERGACSYHGGVSHPLYSH